MVASSIYLMDKHISTLVYAHADRLKVDREDALRHALLFAEIVASVESNNDPMARNPHSTAKGLYQFINGSVAPAVTRLRRYLPEEPWMLSVVQSRDVTQLTRDQQTLLFLADLLGKRGSDRYMLDILRTGDLEAMRKAYMKLHHTKPDIATIKLWERKVRHYV